MHAELLEILACPGCAGDLVLAASETAGADVIAGTLRCAGCASVYPIRASIPRFVSGDEYAGSFGFQWNTFKLEQLDSKNGTTLSRDRFYSETGWTPEWMAGKWILDAGSGAGRFLDVASGTNARVVGVDLSNAIDAARSSLGDRPNLHLVQAGIDRLPFRPGAFGGVYCIGVIQHTSDPEACVRSIARAVTSGGRIAITAYERRRWTLLYSKYLARRLTTHVPDRVLLGTITVLMPILFPLTELLFRLPKIGRVFQFAIPVANYVHERQLSLRQRYRWAILDTFDMLSPRFDRPQLFSDLRRYLVTEGIASPSRRPNAGLNVVGERPAAPGQGA